MIAGLLFAVITARSSAGAVTITLPEGWRRLDAAEARILKPELKPQNKLRRRLCEGDYTCELDGGRITHLWRNRIQKHLNTGCDGIRAVMLHYNQPDSAPCRPPRAMGPAVRSNRTRDRRLSFCAGRKQARRNASVSNDRQAWSHRRFLWRSAVLGLSRARVCRGGNVDDNHRQSCR
jgi:hypothetical protein